MNKKINYQNIKLKSEQNSPDKDFDSIEELLHKKYNLKRPPYTRKGISITQEDIDLAKEIRGRLAQNDPLNIPNESQIFRAGLLALNKLNLEEIINITSKLK